VGQALVEIRAMIDITINLPGGLVVMAGAVGIAIASYFIGRLDAERRLLKIIDDRKTSEASRNAYLYLLGRL
jgi:membrane protein DedA with SNARE-associated domain